MRIFSERTNAELLVEWPDTELAKLLAEIESEITFAEKTLDIGQLLKLQTSKTEVLKAQAVKQERKP